MFIMETDRLGLRPMVERDAPSLHPVFSDPEVMRYYAAPFTEEQTGDWIQRNQMRYHRDGFGLWAVCLKETGAVIGDCGLVKQNVEGHSEIEIGYHIRRQFWGKGFATEAAGACQAYGFGELGLDKLICIMDPENNASIRVAEKLGFTPEQDAFIFDKIHTIYAGYNSK